METKSSPAKYAMGQRVRLTDDSVADIESVTGMKMHDGDKAGRVIGLHFDEDAFDDEKMEVSPAWIYGVEWDRADTTGVYEHHLLPV